MKTSTVSPSGCTVDITVVEIGLVLCLGGISWVQ